MLGIAIALPAAASSERASGLGTRKNRSLAQMPAGRSNSIQVDVLSTLILTSFVRRVLFCVDGQLRDVLAEVPSEGVGLSHEFEAR